VVGNSTLVEKTKIMLSKITKFKFTQQRETLRQRGYLTLSDFQFVSFAER